MIPALDLTRYHARYEHGDILVYLSWWMGSADGPRPCIALLPARRQSWREARPAVVLLDQAWIWDEGLGDPRHCARMCFYFAAGLGFDTNDHNVIFRIRSAIHDHLDELLLMPPMPRDMVRFAHMGDLTITERETGRVHEIEVSERA